MYWLDIIFLPNTWRWLCWWWCGGCCWQLACDGATPRNNIRKPHTAHTATAASAAGLELELKQDISVAIVNECVYYLSNVYVLHHHTIHPLRLPVECRRVTPELHCPHICIWIAAAGAGLTTHCLHSSIRYFYPYLRYFYPHLSPGTGQPEHNCALMDQLLMRGKILQT